MAIAGLGSERKKDLDRHPTPKKHPDDSGAILGVTKKGDIVPDLFGAEAGVSRRSHGPVFGHRVLPSALNWKASRASPNPRTQLDCPEYRGPPAEWPPPHTHAADASA